MAPLGTPSARSTRSRFSSPMPPGNTSPAENDKPSLSALSRSTAFHTAHPPASSDAAGGLKATVRDWLEPPVQNRASYEEAGFQRHGLFEGMAPLGSLPKPSAVKRLTQLPEEKLYHGLASDDDAASTPTPANRPSARQREKDRRERKREQEKLRREKKKAESTGSVRSSAPPPADDDDDDDEDSEGTDGQAQMAQRRLEEEREQMQAEQERPLERPQERPQDETKDEPKDKAERERADAPTKPEGKVSPPKKFKIKRSQSTSTSTSTPTPTVEAPRPQSRVKITNRRADEARMAQAQAQAQADALVSPEPAKPVANNDSAQAPPRKRIRVTSKSSVNAPPLRRPDQTQDEQSDEHEADAETIADASEAKMLPGGSQSRRSLHAETTKAQAEAVDENDDRDADNEDEMDVDEMSGLVPGLSSQRARSDSDATVVNKEMTDHAVDVAVAMAVRHGRLSTARALRTVYDERASDQKFLVQFEDVYQQTADADTLAAFAKLVSDREKEGLKDKDNKAADYFAEAATLAGASASQPWPPRASHNDLLAVDLVKLLDPDEADMWAHERERRQQQLEEQTRRDQLAKEAGEDVAMEEAGAQTGAQGSAQGSAGVGEGEKANGGPSKKRVKLSGRYAKRLEDDGDASAQFATVPTPTLDASAASSAAAKTPTKSTFAVPKPPQPLDSVDAAPIKPAPDGKKSSKPPKVPGRRPGRPSGSTKIKPAELKYAGSGVFSAAMEPLAKSVTPASRASLKKSLGSSLADAAPATPETGTGSRHRRNGSDASVGTVSSLSTAMSVSPPNKVRLKRKAEAQTNETPTATATATATATDDAKTSVGWSLESLMSDAKAKKEADKAKAAQKKEADKDKASRPRSGPGSGRGGRRPGAGRPPKNRALTQPGSSSKATGSGKDGVAHSPAATAVTAVAAGGPAPTGPEPAPEHGPIAARSTTSAKSRAPSTSASSKGKGPALSTSQSHSHETASGPMSPATTTPGSAASRKKTKKTAATPSASTPSAATAATQGPSGSKETPSRSLSKRSSAAAASAAISVSAAAQHKHAEGPAGAEGQKDTTSSTTSTSTSTSGPAAMPSAVQETPGRNTAAAKRARAAAGSASTPATKTPGPATSDKDKDKAKAKETDPTEERRLQMRREARAVTELTSSAPESFIRGPDPDPEEAKPVRQQTRTSARSTRSSLKRRHDQINDGESATPTLAPPAASAASAAASNTSRADTPGPKNKKQRVGPRVKTSPVKKKVSASTSTSRSGAGHASPAANATLSNTDDNDDFCSTCNGSGDLLCCDGCTRSFHFLCIDPPSLFGRELPDEWYCNTCHASRNPADIKHHTGLFGPLANAMEPRNAKDYLLPADIRNLFEGVKTTADGDYDETAQAMAQRARNRRAGYDEVFDYYRLRDFDGNLALCHSCGKSAENPSKKNESGRIIIPCAYCSLWWHVDCIDPPMAQPPVLRNWRCPAHVDDLLDMVPHNLGTTHRFRKIKGASTIKTGYTRGMINNGFIEIASDDEDDELPNLSGWNDPSSFGRIQRVTAQAIQLDFAEHVHDQSVHMTKGQLRRRRMALRQPRPEFRAKTVAAPATTAPAPQVDRQFIDKAQAAQGLATLSGRQRQQDGASSLINALLENADPTMVSFMAQSNPVHLEAGASALSNSDLVALQAMRAQIDQLLRSRAAVDARADAEADAEVVVAADAQVDAPADADAAEVREDMSLVTDNGDDEELPTIITPTASGVLETLAADESVSTDTAVAEGAAAEDDVREWTPETKASPGAGVLHHHSQLSPVVLPAAPASAGQSSSSDKRGDGLPSPLSPPGTSDAAAEDDEARRKSNAEASEEAATADADAGAETEFASAATDTF